MNVARTYPRRTTGPCQEGGEVGLQTDPAFAGTLFYFFFDAQIGNPPSPHLRKGFHIVIATLAMQDELDLDLGRFLLCIDAAAVDQMGGMDFTKTFCRREIHIVILGSGCLNLLPSLLLLQQMHPFANQCQ